MTGRVEAIHVATKKAAPTEPRERVTVVAGRGVEGDRKFDSNHDLTLVEAEALEDAGLGFAESRRNVVTRGVDLNGLVGVRFRVGEVECMGRRLCEPCRHLEKLEGDGLMRSLAGRGGLRADVLSDGSIALGDAVVSISDD